MSLDLADAVLALLHSRAHAGERLALGQRPQDQHDRRAEDRQGHVGLRHHQRKADDQRADRRVAGERANGVHHHPRLRAGAGDRVDLNGHPLHGGLANAEDAHITGRGCELGHLGGKHGGGRARTTHRPASTLARATRERQDDDHGHDQADRRQQAERRGDREQSHQVEQRRDRLGGVLCATRDQRGANGHQFLQLAHRCGRLRGPRRAQERADEFRLNAARDIRGRTRRGDRRAQIRERKPRRREPPDRGERPRRLRQNRAQGQAAAVAAGRERDEQDDDRRLADTARQPEQSECREAAAWRARAERKGRPPGVRAVTDAAQGPDHDDREISPGIATYPATRVEAVARASPRRMRRANWRAPTSRSPRRVRSSTNGQSAPRIARPTGARRRAAGPPGRAVPVRRCRQDTREHPAYLALVISGQLLVDDLDRRVGSAHEELVPLAHARDE